MAIVLADSRNTFATADRNFFLLCTGTRIQQPFPSGDGDHQVGDISGLQRLEEDFQVWLWQQ